MSTSTEQLLSETRMTLAQVAKAQRVSVRSVWRWTHGARRVRLESFLLGKRRYTTREAFVRFVAARSRLGSPTERAEQQDFDEVLASL